jgi:DNA-binding LacI/PurR family transcriptional regulator
MPLRLHRTSVVDQVAAALRSGVTRGEWHGWLPGERRLCDDLHVGRNTLRAALRQLAQEGVVEIVSGTGTRIQHASAIQPAKEAQVGLLSPEPLERLRPRQALWIDELRGRLAENGSLLKVFHGSQFFRANPASALKRLIEQEQCGCWILVLSNKACQEWFKRLRIPCVIAGSCHQGVNLPFVDLDYRALCRHAATTFLRLGHRRIAFITHAQGAAGDMASEVGFMEGVHSFSQTDAAGKIVHHGQGKEAVRNSLRLLMERPAPPTALLINNSYLYLTVFSILTQRGYRVPRDVSLLSRDADTFLSYVDPEPACYVEDPHVFARKLARIADKLSHESPAKPPQVWLIPRLVPGASLAGPAATPLART